MKAEKIKKRISEILDRKHHIELKDKSLIITLFNQIPKGKIWFEVSFSMNNLFKLKDCEFDNYIFTSISMMEDIVLELSNEN